MRLAVNVIRDRQKSIKELSDSDKYCIYVFLLGEAVFKLSGKVMTRETARKALYGLVHKHSYHNTFLVTSKYDDILSIDDDRYITLDELDRFSDTVKDYIDNKKEDDELYVTAMKTIETAIVQPRIPVFHNDVRRLIKQLDIRYNGVDSLVYNKIIEVIHECNMDSSQYKVGDKILNLVYQMGKYTPDVNGSDVIDVCGRLFKVSKRRLRILNKDSQ